MVSIQPKPKKGLVERRYGMARFELACFNPAEAEEGFSRKGMLAVLLASKSFNPAEAEEGFSSKGRTK